MHQVVQLHQKNPVLPPKEKGGPFRVRLLTAYLDNADFLFGELNGNSFTFMVDDERYSACLDQELSAPFRIVPGPNPTIEIVIDVYADSYDRLIRGKSFYISND